MKKILIFVFSFLCAGQLYSQSKMDYKIGLVGTVSTEARINDVKLAFASFLATANYDLSKKIDLSLTSGYMRYINEGEGFGYIPALVGVKYKFDEFFYAGADLGASFYTRVHQGTDFAYSGYVGMKVKHLSVDLRYLETIREQNIRTLGLVISYSFK